MTGQVTETGIGGWSRRRLVWTGIGAVAGLAAAGAGGLDLVAKGVLPGQQLLGQIDGACAVPVPPYRFAAQPGPAISGSFHSRARRRTVGYQIAYPPGHRPGSELPLIVALHGFGGNHSSTLSRVSPAQALALGLNGRPLPPMAMACADGGPGYWNPHPGDDPMGMVIGELIPMCQRLGLGRQRPVGALGISMGGFGAIFFAERYPGLFRAVAAIGPAVWTSYEQARGANAGAFASAADFARDDIVTHAGRLAGVAVRIASGLDDPFHPGVRVLAGALPAGAVVDFAPGCHTGEFFAAQQPPSLAFLGQHLAA